MYPFSCYYYTDHCYYYIEVMLISLLISKAIYKQKILHRNKIFLLSPVYKDLRDLFVVFFFLQNKPVQRMNEETEEINCIIDEGKTRMNRKITTLTFFELYKVHIKN